MDEKLWAGVELKLQNAEFHFDMMGRSIQPPEQTAINVTSGAIIDADWHRAFAYFDAFLSTARSVPELIQCCFGVDCGHPDMKEWFKNKLPLTNRIDGMSSRRSSNRTMLAFVRSPSQSPQYYRASWCRSGDGHDQRTVWSDIHRHCY